MNVNFWFLMAVPLFVGGGIGMSSSNPFRLNSFLTAILMLIISCLPARFAWLALRAHKDHRKQAAIIYFLLSWLWVPAFVIAGNLLAG